MAGWLVVRRPSVRSRTRLVNRRRGIQALARGGAASMQPAPSSAQRLRFALRHDGRETAYAGCRTQLERHRAPHTRPCQAIRLHREDLVHLGERVGYRYAPTNSGVPPDVKDLVRAGRTLEALSRYREVTGASLEQAKAVVLSL
jgi:hypothetical protein